MDRFQQAKQIAAGATNLIRLQLNLHDHDVEDIHRKRFAVCLQCPNRDAELNSCQVCGCFLAIKTRSMESSCPEKYWFAAR